MLPPTCRTAKRSPQLHSRVPSPQFCTAQATPYSTASCRTVIRQPLNLPDCYKWESVARAPGGGELRRGALSIIKNSAEVEGEQ